jgi:5-(carboxyamino)imidazole ribonucleotide synthase
VTQVRSNAGSNSATSKPIGPYERLQAEVHEWDPKTADVAARVAELVAQHRPDLTVEHIGSTAVPGLPGKGIVDLSIETDPADIPAVVSMLYDLGFAPQPGPDPWPPTRPMPVGSIDIDGERYRIHLHVQPVGGDYQRDLAFRDALRNDPELRSQYEGLKRGITDAGPVEGLRYTHSKTAWILQVYRRLGFAPPPIAPPSTIGIIGGGQLGRMLALSARDLGYRVVVLDPDPDAPAVGLADRVEVGAYDDVAAALRMAEGCAVITYELEHVGPAVVAALDDRKRPMRPGQYPLKLTADRLAERRFVEANEGRVAPWRAVSSHADVLEAAAELGYPVRLKAARGGYDGRSQVKLEGTAGIGEVDGRFGWPSLLEQELDFEAELSVVVARNVDGISRTFPVARNRHDNGILVETVVPAGIPPDVERAASTLACDLATSMGLVGTLTVELFLLRDGSLVVNELAPRVHNSGHWSIEGAVTSQFEQHLRAICGLPLGSVEMRAPAVAMVNLLGEGAPRDAHPLGIYDVLEVPDAHLHLYDKHAVFERRKMGHVTALGATPEEALDRAREAAGHITWRE